jgi:ubiquinone/menaquinone biosynthesis C-methylase UbiE
LEDFQKYFDTNRRSWDKATPFHIQSSFYDHAAFLAGASTLKPIEENLLGDLEGKALLHLQCHFGQDTISLQRKGALVTGVDFSEAAIEEARRSAAQLSIPADFICCNIYDLPRLLDKRFDIVFTSYGVIGWLPDLKSWAALINRFLKPGGRFLMAEFHPFVWTLDSEFKGIGYDYFNAGPIFETLSGTYADPAAPIEQEHISWNHSLSEVFQALLNEGMHIDQFHEYDYSPYPCFPSLREDGPGEFRFSHLAHRIPMVYALSAVKPGDQRASLA